MAGVLAVHDAALGDVLSLTSQLTLETILYHQCIRMWSFAIRLLAPSPRSKDTSSPYGKTTSQRRANRPLSRITRFQNSLPWTTISPPIRPP
jgi:hypothetical protein